jgi:hypothetical protein
MNVLIFRDEGKYFWAYETEEDWQWFGPFPSWEAAKDDAEHAAAEAQTED